MVVKELFARLGLDVDGVAFAKGEAAIAGLRTGLLAFASAAVAGVAVAGAAFAKHSADLADAARKQSNAAGVNSIAWQEFAYAAKLADIETGELAQSLKFLAKSGVKDVKAEVLRLADVFNKMPNDGRRVQFAVEKFGRSGAKMINLFRGGTEELTKAMEEAHTVGTVFSEEEQIAAEEFNDQITRLKYAITGLSNAIGKVLVPPLTKVIVWLRNGVLALRQLHVETNTVITALKVFAALLGGAVLAALIANASAAATAASWYAALGVAALVNGAKMAAAWLIGIAPVALLAVVIAALILAIEDVWVSLNGGKALINEIGPKWTKLLDSFLKANPEDPWWLAALKSAGRIITDLQGSWQKLAKSFRETFGMKDPDAYDATSPEAIAQRRKTYAAMGYAVSNVPAFSTGTSHEASVSLPMGGGSSPTSSAALHVKPTEVTYTPIKIDKIEVNATTGADAKQIANETRAAMEEFHKAKLREAEAGIE